MPSKDDIDNKTIAKVKPSIFYTYIPSFIHYLADLFVGSDFWEFIFKQNFVILVFPSCLSINSIYTWIGIENLKKKILRF